MTDILERLRGYNPIDRTSDNIRAAKDIHDAADEIERLRRGIKTIWSMCHTCNYVEPVQDELERLMNGHEPVKQEIPDEYVDRAKQTLTTERDDARTAARMLFTAVTCHDLHHTPAQYHQSDEPCKARAAFVEKYPFLKENPNESDQTP